MITEFILNIFLAGIDALTSLFPSFDVPTFTETGSGVFGTIGSLNGIFPVMTMILCLVAAIAVIIGLNIWDLIVFVYHQFWGSN